MSGEVVMKKKLSVIILLSVSLSLFTSNLFSWNGPSHSQMTGNAAALLETRLSELLGFPISAERFLGPDSLGSTDFAYLGNFTALRWLTQGSTNEDGYYYWQLGTHYMRSVNHFYNPFWNNVTLYPYQDTGGNRARNWYIQAGGLSDSIMLTMTDLIDIWTGKPSPNWAYDGCPTVPPESDFGGKNYFSSTYARKYYYAALSGDSTELNGIAGITGNAKMSEYERSYCFASLFRSLGQIMHLVQDSGNPEHTRNEAHPESDLPIFGGFERYVKSNYNFTQSSVPDIPWTNIVKSDSPIMDFFDSDRSDTHCASLRTRMDCGK